MERKLVSGMYGKTRCFRVDGGNVNKQEPELYRVVKRGAVYDVQWLKRNGLGRPGYSWYRRDDLSPLSTQAEALEAIRTDKYAAE